MARHFLADIDLNKNQLLNAVIQNLATAPSSPYNGQIYYNTTVNKPYVYNGTSWVDLTTSSEAGTVTSVSIVSANGISGTVANPTTTPAITLSLGAITPSTVNGITISAGSGTLNLGAKTLNVSNTITLAAASDNKTLNIGNGGTLGTAAFANTGTGNGNVPVLDASGKLNSSVLPALAITDTFVVASESAMLALTAEVGDVAVRTDINKSFILKTAGASTLANWQELLSPTDAVTSVAGRTGAVTLSNTDISGLGTMATQNANNVTISGGSITGISTLGVAVGGTGLSTVTANSYLKGNGTGALVPRTYAEVKTDLGLNLVENTAISTWAGSSNIVTVGTLTAGNATAIVSAATEALAGKIEIATQAEADAGTDNVRAITPLKLAGYITNKAITKKVTDSITGNGALTSFSVNHNLNTRDVAISVYDDTSGESVFIDEVRNTVNQATFSFNSAPASGKVYRVVIIG